MTTTSRACVRQPDKHATMNMTLDRMRMWLKSAQRGNRITYHTGNLQADRQTKLPVATTIDGIARVAYQASQAGVVDLVQRRVSDGVCAYEAVMR